MQLTLQYFNISFCFRLKNNYAKVKELPSKNSKILTGAEYT